MKERERKKEIFIERDRKREREREGDRKRGRKTTYRISSPKISVKIKEILH